MTTIPYYIKRSYGGIKNIQNDAYYPHYIYTI